MSSDVFTCFECGKISDEKHDHHVIPRSLGGTKTVTLCLSCHGKAHSRVSFASRDLIKRGLQNAKERGTKFGRPVEIDKDPVLSLLKEGLTCREIGKILGCSPATVSRVSKSQDRVYIIENSSPTDLLEP